MDRAVSIDCKTRGTNLFPGWIDYQKAYASVPYTWILESLKLYKVNRTLRAFFKNPIWLWKSILEANSKPISQVNPKCSIY